MSDVTRVKIDERELAYREDGNPQGFPLFFAHGSPGTCLEGRIFHHKAQEYGFRFISVERPGMGHTTALSSRAMSSSGKDILALANPLGIE